MASTDKVSVLRVAIVTDTDTPVYEYDFIPPTGRSVPPVSPRSATDHCEMLINVKVKGPNVYQRCSAASQ